MTEIILSCVIGYLLGSIPFGLILTKFAGHGDIRSIGSGNIGATNVLRTGNKKLAALTLLLDMAKGAVAVYITFFILQIFMDACPECKNLSDPMLCSCISQFPEVSLYWSAFFALLGHMFPVWLKFKGGKGVATGLGVIFALSWPIGLTTAATWLVMAFAFRISSLSALVAVALSPVYAWLMTSNIDLVVFCICAAALIIIKHHANIKRLLKGEEPKIGKKKEAA